MKPQKDIETMRHQHSFPSYILAGIAIIGASALAQNTAPSERISVAINNDHIVPLKGSLHPAAQLQYEAGRLTADTRLNGMSMIFRRSEAQQADLESLIVAQQDPASPHYHQWLTSELFAARFGMSESDVEKVESWLQQQGFAIDAVSRSRSVIHFSGTVSQVEQAFGTEMHFYRQNGVKHFAPSTELSLPATIAPQVLAIGNLSNFRPTPMHIRGSAPRPRPDFTSGVSGSVFFAPGDIETIYDINPLLNSSFNGSGQTIVVAGQSAIVTSDVENFQRASGLTVNDPNQVLVPGTGTPQIFSGDEAESDLDLEWSGAIAKGATIDFIYTGSNTNYGVFDSIQYAVDQQIGDIISVSYGACETEFSNTDILALESVMAQAATQGQTIVAAAGDSGSTACYGSPDLDTTQQQTLAVNYPASSQYVTGVGGTEISQANAAYYTQGSPYWKAETLGTDFATSALQYIPEVAWNDSVITAPAGRGLSATGGGASALFNKPSWQTEVSGIPADGKRDVPDISLFSSPQYTAYLFCTSDQSEWSAGQQASCNSGFRDGATNDLTLAAGTSFAAPIFAAMVAIINQQKGYVTGQGMVNPALYRLASDPTIYASAFHDITVGNNECPASLGTTYCSNTSGAETNYAAGVGYDQLTGLGSIDLNNLTTSLTATAPATMTVTPAETTLTANQSLNVAVTLAGSSGTPTGTVSLSGGGDSSQPETLIAGGYTFTIPPSSLSAGTDALAVSYSGDSTYAASSGTTSVTVTKLGSGLTASESSSNITANASFTVFGTVSGSGPTPTGTVTLTSGSYTSVAVSLFGMTGEYAITVPANSLIPGTDTVMVAYSGDVNYSGSSNSVIVTVTPSVLLVPTIIVSPAFSMVSTGQPLNVVVTVTGSSVPPRGSVTLSGSGYTSSAQTLNGSSSAYFAIPSNTFNAGSTTLTADYSGDANYAAASGAATITVTDATTFTLAASTPSNVNRGSQTSSTISVASSTNYSGTVTLVCSLNAGGPTNQTGDAPTCSISSTRVSAGETAVATVSTTAAANSGISQAARSGRAFADTSYASLALVFLLVTPAHRRRWRSMLRMLVLLVGISCLAACGASVQEGGGSGSTGNLGTASGTYSFTVTGTGNPVVSPAPTATFSITVN